MNTDRFGRPMCSVCGRYGRTETCEHRRIARGTPEQRFMDKVRVDDNACWNWTGFIHRTGYGRFSPHGKPVMAHRWAFEHFRAPVDRGLDLDHLCRNRACVNPDHLEPVTRLENVRRGRLARAAA